MPQLYRAFVSTGQMANFSNATSAGFHVLLEQAGRSGDKELEAQLTALGEPPYRGAKGNSKRAKYVGLLEKHGNLWHAESGFTPVRWMLAAQEYAWPEKFSFNRAAETSFEALLPDLLALDMAELVPRVEVPVYYAVGRHDLMAPPAVASAYFSRLVAPKKEWVWFEQSAHFPQWEEPSEFPSSMAC